MVSGNLFVSVILPVKFKEEVLYLLPDSFLHYNSPTAAGECKVAPGTRVRVHFGKREMIGVVRGFRYADRGEVPLERLGKPLEYKEIDGVVGLPAIKREQLEFWQVITSVLWARFIRRRILLLRLGRRALRAASRQSSFWSVSLFPLRGSRSSDCLG